MIDKLVSILIPVYNRATLVGKTIDSAIHQSYRNIEIIVVDNHSTDDTWDILQSYAAKDKRIRIFRNEENVGPVLNWKRCLDEARGEYAKILFSDDLIETDFIEKTLAVFDANTAFVLSEVIMFGRENKILSNYKTNTRYSSTEYLKDSLLGMFNKFPISPGCALFRTDDLKKSLLIDIPNPFNLDFKKYGAGNDLLLFLLTACRYNQVRIAPDTKALFRDHSSSFTMSNNLSIYYDYTRFYFITPAGTRPAVTAPSRC